MISLKSPEIARKKLKTTFKDFRNSTKCESDSRMKDVIFKNNQIQYRSKYISIGTSAFTNVVR